MGAWECLGLCTPILFWFHYSTLGLGTEPRVALCLIHVHLYRAPINGIR